MSRRRHRHTCEALPPVTLEDFQVECRDDTLTISFVWEGNRVSEPVSNLAEAYIFIGQRLMRQYRALTQGGNLHIAVQMFYIYHDCPVAWRPDPKTQKEETNEDRP